MRGPEAGADTPGEDALGAGEVAPGARKGRLGTGGRPPRLILASASPRRLAILRQLRLAPEVRPADLDESYLPGESPAEHVERLARAKAGAVAKAACEDEVTPGGSPVPLLVVGGDTVVVDVDRVLAKPVDRDDAVQMLLSLSGRSHEVLSGLALTEAGGGSDSLGVNGPAGEVAHSTPSAHSGEDRPPTTVSEVRRTVSEVSRTVVRMRPFDEETARRYVETGEPVDKAGAYGIQGMGAALVEAVEGDYYSVVGFPVGVFLDLLERAGWRFAFGRLTRSRTR